MWPGVMLTHRASRPAYISLLCAAVAAQAGTLLLWLRFSLSLRLSCQIIIYIFERKKNKPKLTYAVSDKHFLLELGISVNRRLSRRSQSPSFPISFWVCIQMCIRTNSYLNAHGRAAVNGAFFPQNVIVVVSLCCKLSNWRSWWELREIWMTLEI